MQLTQETRDTLLIVIPVILLFILLAIVAIASSIPAPAQDNKIYTPLFIPAPSVTDLCYQAAYSSLNSSYVLDAEYSAFHVWNILMKQGINCHLLTGNLAISNESIIQCDSVWVVVDSMAIDGGRVFTDPQHLEGYIVHSPQQYRELRKAIDEYHSSKEKYLSAVDLYNAQLSPVAKITMEYTQGEYINANNKLISEIP